MSRICRALITAGLLLGGVQASPAQTADEIAEKHLAAIGGRQALAKLTSRTMTGTITLTSPVGELSGAFEILNRTPNKMRLAMKIDLTSLGAGTMTFEERFDGASGYIIDSLQGNRDITGDQLEAMKNAMFPSSFLGYKERGATLELGGREKVGERDAYLLTLKSKSGPVERQYIDAESFLLVRTVVKVNAPPVGEIEQTTELLDYQDIDGVKVPFHLKILSSAQNIDVKVASVQQNQPVDESLFSKP